MITGDPAVFAIESAVLEAYEQLSFRALGFFAVHVGGYCFGRREPDSTMHACSFDAVANRIAKRGQHTAPFSAEPDAARIADAFRDAVFAEEAEESYFGLGVAEFSQFFYESSSDCVWAPDGDEAFDDGSYVLQFDVEERVRLIAFKCVDDGHHDPESLRDIWLPAEDFYSILQRWHNAFYQEWEAAVSVKRELH